MNQTTLTHHSEALNRLVVNPITETIQVEIADSYAPILIDLHHLFGGEYTFRAAVEVYGVVDVDLIDKNGLLYLSANAEARHGARTRIAVDARDASGQVKLTTIDVEAVSIGSVATVVA